jgi:hypothetical protein
MNKIYGNTQVIERAQNASPGDPLALINWDAIQRLPNQYEVLISEVKFSLLSDFSDIGNKTYMPTPSLMYKIAEARGIYGIYGKSEPIYETVDLSEMTMGGTSDFQNIIVGYSSTKRSAVKEEDGVERPSDFCTIDYNVWNRVTEIWAAEEVATDGYEKVINGEYKHYKDTMSGPHYFVQKGKYKNAVPVKYGTKWARKKHFKSELKFAMQKAETKAHEKTIRVLCGMLTGYKGEELKEGRFIFAKVRRSLEDMQLESAARLTALSKDIDCTTPAGLLFGDVDKEMPVSGSEFATGGMVEGHNPPTSLPHSLEPSTEEKPIPPHQKMVDTIDTYNQNGLIGAELAGTASSIIRWIEGEGEASVENVLYWDRAKDVLREIESGIKQELRINHGLLND